MARKMDRLSAKSAKAKDKAGYYADGGGLYLQVSATKSKSWILSYMLNGKEREMGLGSLLDVSLSEAREKRDSYRKLLRAGVDPIETRRQVELEKALARARSMTFDQCAKAYIEANKPDWKNAKHAAQWGSTLETYCGPVFGSAPVQDVDTGLVLKALEPIWTKTPETATRVRGRIERVLDWARVRGYRSGENPARWRGHLDKILPKLEKRKRVKHHPALPFHQMGAFMVALRAEEGIAARALEVLILTTLRTEEVIGSKPAEFDLAECAWTVPADRMKMGIEHRAPLSARPVAIVREMLKLGGDFVFPGQKARKPLSNMAMLAVLKRMDEKSKANGGAGWRDPKDGRIATPHGFRSSFRDWASELTNYPREVCEMALAHSVGNEVEAAYRRGDLFEKRRKLMEAWARFCDTPVKGKVLSLKRA